MGDIILLYNSFSGKGKGIILAQSIQKYLLQRNIQFSSFKDSWPESIPSFARVCLIGGDGTINYFLNKYGIIDNGIMIFPGGTGNDFYFHLYHNLDIEKQMNQLIVGRIQKVDIGICNGKYFANMIGLGFDGAVLKSIHHYKWLGGHLGYLIAVIRNIFTYKEIPLRIHVGGQSIKKQWLLCIIANASRTGGGFMVSPHSVTDDGYFNWITCEKISIFKRLLLLPSVEKGQHLTRKEVTEELINTICIHAEEAIAYQLDGELMMDKVIDVSIIPAGLNVFI